MKTARTLCHLCVLLCMASLAWLLTGCHEVEDDYVSKYCPGSCTVIKGRVSTDNGSVPVAGATLRVQWDKSYYLSGGTTRNKAIATTDENGEYELRFLLRDDELLEGDIEIIADFDRYSYLSCQSWDYFPSGSLSRDTTIIRNYAIAPRAGMQVVLTSQEPLAPEDAFRVILKYKLSPSDPDSCVAVFDAQESHENYVAVPADTPLAVRVEKTKAGVRTTEKEVLTLQPGETRTYETVF